MSRVRTADQCLATKPAQATDKRIVHCGRRAGHAGPHSSGKFYKWTSEYPKERKA